jgi:hypothetical protein
MALGLLFAGIVLLIAGWRGTYANLFSTFFSDLGGFLPWVAAIVAIGAIGYIPELRMFSNGLLALIFLVIFISNKGVFAQWQQLAQSPPQAIASTPLIPTADQSALLQNPTVNIGFSGGSGSGSSSGAASGGAAAGLFHLFGF